MVLQILKSFYFAGTLLNMAQFQSGTFEVFCTKIDIVEEILNHLYEEF